MSFFGQLSDVGLLFQLLWIEFFRYMFWVWLNQIWLGVFVVFLCFQAYNGLGSISEYLLLFSKGSKPAFLNDWTAKWFGIWNSLDSIATLRYRFNKSCRCKTPKASWDPRFVIRSGDILSVLPSFLVWSTACL